MRSGDPLVGLQPRVAAGGHEVSANPSLGDASDAERLGAGLRGELGAAGLRNRDRCRRLDDLTGR